MQEKFYVVLCVWWVLQARVLCASDAAFCLIAYFSIEYKVYIYIYIYTEREREREREISFINEPVQIDNLTQLV